MCRADATPVAPRRSPPQQTTTVTICIATYQRPQQLARLLDSLSHQEFRRSPRPRIRIAIVDNSPQGSLADAAAELAARAGHFTQVIHEPRPGIPAARNAAVEVACGEADLIAFIDDDETAVPRWLDELLYARQRFGADVVAGARVQRFPDGTPSWIIESGFFDRGRKPTGTPLDVCSSANVLVGVDLFELLDCHFDESLALTGGSDTEFFLRATDAGTRIVWCDEAVVYEWIQPERLTVRWLVRRRFRYGNTLGLLTRRREPLVSWRVVLRAVKSFGHVVLGLLAAASGLVRGRTATVSGLRRAAFGVGTVVGLANRRFREYARQGPASAAGDRSD